MPNFIYDGLKKSARDFRPPFLTLFLNFSEFLKQWKKYLEFEFAYVLLNNKALKDHIDPIYKNI